MAKLGNILNPKIIIPVLVGTALFGFVLYILLAPATWWKPFYVRVDMGDTTAQTEEVTQQTANTQPVAQQPVAAPVTGPRLPGYMQVGQPVSGVMYQLDTTVVNLAEPGGLRYLQVAIVLEFWPLIENYYDLEAEAKALAEDEFKASIDEWRPVIDDLVMTTLSSKTYNDIATIDGKEALKSELMVAINEMMGYEGVINVYFTNFLIQ